LGGDVEIAVDEDLLGMHVGAAPDGLHQRPRNSQGLHLCALTLAAPPPKQIGQCC
jgi:hypothetical protein